MRSRSHLQFVALVLTLGFCVNAQAVILYSTDQRNTDPPGSLTNRGTWYGPQGAGDPRQLLNSGWQYEGQFGIFLGTPISSQYFVTARHLYDDAAVGVGTPFYYPNQAGQMTAYTTTNVYRSSNSDLVVFKIAETFDSWAPMYDAATDGSEVGKPIMIIGRGTQRGAEVQVSNVLKGWQWGTWDTVESWGQNVVSRLELNVASGNKQYGDLLAFDFDAGAGPNEGALSGGDSGGGVFINVGGIWKLAGINFSVDGPWSTNAGQDSFNGAIFDASGLYVPVGNIPTWELVTEGVGSSYSTRISSNLSWIESSAGLVQGAASVVPEPAGLSIFILALATLRGRSRG